jgi:hypothetical protein
MPIHEIDLEKTFQLPALHAAYIFRQNAHHVVVRLSCADDVSCAKYTS